MCVRESRSRPRSTNPRRANVIGANRVILHIVAAALVPGSGGAITVSLFLLFFFFLYNFLSMAFVSHTQRPSKYADREKQVVSITRHIVPQNSSEYLHNQRVPANMHFCWPRALTTMKDEEEKKKTKAKIVAPVSSVRRTYTRKMKVNVRAWLCRSVDFSFRLSKLNE